MESTPRPGGLSGVLRVTIVAALVRPGTNGPARDLAFEVNRRDGVWDRECIAEARDYNAPLHEFRIDRGPDEAVWRFAGSIDPDPWVAGGPLTVTVRLDGETGLYEGEFAGRPISGRAVATFEPKPRPSRGRAAPRLEVLDEYRRAGAASRLYDYARAGCGYGDEPVAPDGPVFRARDFGAHADSGEEASAGIQAALTAAGRAGGGIVLLEAGVYDVRVDAWCDPLRIPASRVVLRGQGSGPDGTLIVNHRYADSPEPAKPWLAGQWPILRADGGSPTDGQRVARILEARRGSTEVRVDRSDALAVGATYALNHMEGSGGALIRALVGDACEPAANYRKPGAALVTQLVTVTAICGDRVDVDLPLHWSLGDGWDAELATVTMLRGVGVENLRLRSHWDGHFVHHKSPEHDNGWDHVGLSKVEHSWVRGVVSENATTSVSLLDAKNCTLMDCRITGNPGHNGYTVGGGSTANLLLRLDCERPMHAFNLSGRICGNVLHDCRISEPGGVDLHGGTCLDTLVDRLTGGVLVGGGSDRAVPPRHGPGLTLWNWCQGHYHPYQAWRRVERIARWGETPGFIAVGVHAGDGHRCGYLCREGIRFDDRHDGDAWVESNNQAVAPSSLYRLQVEARRGSMADSIAGAGRAP